MPFCPLAVLNLMPRWVSAHCRMGTSLHQPRGNTQHPAPEAMVASTVFRSSQPNACGDGCVPMLSMLSRPLLRNIGRPRHDAQILRFAQMFSIRHDARRFHLFQLLLNPSRGRSCPPFTSPATMLCSPRVEPSRCG